MPRLSPLQDRCAALSAALDKACVRLLKTGECPFDFDFGKCADPESNCEDESVVLACWRRWALESDGE